MRVFLILLFLITNFTANAQFENSWRIKKTFQKTKNANDSVLTLTSFEERDLAGKLILKADFIPQENIQFLTRYIYEDTFVTKKIITEQKMVDKDTIISIDSIIREIRSDFHPIFEDSTGKDIKGRIKITPLKLEKGHKIIFSTHYDTRYDSHLRYDAQGTKKKKDFSYYQLIHEYFIEYDSLERKVAEYSSNDKWEYDKVNFRKYEYDQAGQLTKILKSNKDSKKEKEFYLEKSLLNIYSDSIFTENELKKKNTGHYSDVIVYNLKGNKTEEMTFLYTNKVQSACLYLYDEKDRLYGIQCISGETRTEKNSYFLNENSFEVSKIETVSQYKNQPAELVSENFRFNDNNHLLIEQYEDKNGIKFNWYIYEYVFH